ncbi:hypothetical protein ACOMHN_066767 [Nucella lapillus]
MSDDEQQQDSKTTPREEKEKEKEGGKKEGGKGGGKEEGGGKEGGKEGAKEGGKENTPRKEKQRKESADESDKNPDDKTDHHPHHHQGRPSYPQAHRPPSPPASHLVAPSRPSTTNTTGAETLSMASDIPPIRPPREAETVRRRRRGRREVAGHVPFSESLQRELASVAETEREFAISRMTRVTLDDGDDTPAATKRMISKISEDVLEIKSSLGKTSHHPDSEDDADDYTPLSLRRQRDPVYTSVTDERGTETEDTPRNQRRPRHEFGPRTPGSAPGTPRRRVGGGGEGDAPEGLFREPSLVRISEDGERMVLQSSEGTEQEAGESSPMSRHWRFHNTVYVTPYVIAVMTMMMTTKKRTRKIMRMKRRRRGLRPRRTLKGG